MKRVYYLSYFLCLFIAMSLASCSDENNNTEIQTGVTGQSWKEGIPVELTVENVKSVSFHAAADWTASTNSSWCKLLTQKGEKGANVIKLSVATSDTQDRTSTITIKVEGYSAASFQVIQKGSTEIITEDTEINRKVEAYLSEYYLWNEEYKELTHSFTKNYEDFFYDGLGSMTTNTLDKRTYIGSDGKTYYRLYSYIQQLPSYASTRATKYVDKEPTYSFGITGITAVSIGTQTNNTIYFCVQGVYPNSPASEAGIKRGAMISLVNGQKISNSNINDFYYSMLLPDEAFSLSLTEDLLEGGSITGTQERTISSTIMACNPVILSKVKEDIEGHRIGYLVYAGFDAGFDEELFDAFKEFKSKNVTDLILDLRYNGGGHTISANLIATCIAGSASQGQVFSSQRYNKERMAKLNNKREEETFAYSNYPNLGTSLSAGDLGLSRVYCLVGEGTASSSELVINALRGIDMEVILIGEKTTGKNVGMEYTDMKIKTNTYRVVPITFQSYNAKGFGDYEKGFTPTVAMDETNPYNESGRFYIHKDYMTDKEPLYAKAIELITGKNLMPATRSVEQPMNGRTRKLPAIFRPGRDGMLRPAQPVE